MSEMDKIMIDTELIDIVYLFIARRLLPKSHFGGR